MTQFISQKVIQDKVCILYNGLLLAAVMLTSLLANPIVRQRVFRHRTS